MQPKTVIEQQKTNRRLKARWPEERVHRCVLEQRTAGRGSLTVQLRLHALVLEMNINDFAGESSWCYRFHATQPPLYQSTDSGVTKSQQTSKPSSTVSVSAFFWLMRLMVRKIRYVIWPEMLLKAKSASSGQFLSSFYVWITLDIFKENNLLMDVIIQNMPVSVIFSMLNM